MSNGKRTPFAWKLSQLQIGPQPKTLSSRRTLLSPAPQRATGISRRQGG